MCNVWQSLLGVIGLSVEDDVGSVIERHLLLFLLRGKHALAAVQRY